MENGNAYILNDKLKGLKVRFQETYLNILSRLYFNIYLYWRFSKEFLIIPDLVSGVHKNG